MPPRKVTGRALPALLLVLATLAVYAQAPGFGFINLDDNVYVTENAHVLGGPTREGIAWAWTTRTEANWHPLTWMSLQIDAALGGGAPRPFHATNVVLHAINVLLLFLLLERMTGSRWRSALAAALFALHPLHVESVAWIAERKDVLSTAFGLAACHAWLSYVRNGGAGRLALAAAAHAASLMSKPMFVSLPLLLLVFDFWPLARLAPVRARIVEKLPFLAIAAASCLVTLAVQSHGGATRSLVQYPIASRVANALVTTVTYLGKAVWPAKLAAYYPYPYEGIPGWKSAGAAIAIALVSWLCWRLRARAPYVAAGWVWYLVTLVPVIGLVQVGSQGMADRYTYVPLVGPFVSLAWGLGALVDRAPWPRARVAAAAIAVTALLALGVVAQRQAATWRDSETVFTHALAVTTDNAVAHNNLARALLERGEIERGVAECAEAVRIAPDMGAAQSNLVRGLIALRRLDEAKARAAEGLAARPSDPRAHVNVGLIAMTEGRLDEAIAMFQEALALDANDVDAHLNLGAVLMRQGNTAEAIVHFEQAVRLRPGDARAARALERARAAETR